MVRAIIIVCVVIAILDYLLIFAIYKGDNEYGLLVFAPAHNLHCRCDNRKVEYEDMTNAEKFWETFGLIQKNPDEPIVLDKIWLEGKYIKPLGDSVIGIEDIGSFIQHVGYSQEACGYEK